MDQELSILEGKDAPEEARKSSYESVNRFFQQHVNSTELDQSVVSKLVSMAAEEIIASKNTDVVNEALQTVIFCMNLEQIVLKLSIDDCNSVVKRLCLCIHQTVEKTCCHRALFALATQKMADTVIQDKCDVILCAVEFAVEKWQGQSLTVENESINVVKRLLQQAPQAMDVECTRWGRILVPMVAHKAIKVRENALAVTMASLENLRKCQKDLHACLKPALKQTIIPGLKALMNDSQQIYALKTWGVLVQMFGKELHSSSNLNMVLSVVEMGLRSIGTIEPRIAALHAWQHLIDNFSLNSSFLQDPKMVKLVMQALKFNNAKNESLALTKVKVWWHFIWLLDTKLSANFDLVCAPLLQFCVYGGSSSQKVLGSTPKIIANTASPATPHLKLPSPGPTQNFTFPSTQLLGCEALAHFLGSVGCSMKDHNFQLDCLRQDVVTGPTFFIKQSTLFITTAADLFSNLGSAIPESLVLHIWERLISHMKAAIESAVKLDVRDALSTLLLRFQVVALSRNFSVVVVLKMLKEVCSLPKKVLGSTAYSIGTGEMVNGTPALFLLSLLLTPNLLQASPETETYHTVFNMLVSSRSGHSTSTLEFLQTVLELLSTNSEFLEDKETVWRLWSAVVQVLTENIKQTNEVNQGDALECNFSCCIQSLVFPAKLNLASLSVASVKSMMKTWSDLYTTVNRLAALVPSAGANCVCDEVACSLLDIAKGVTSVSESCQVEMFVQMCNAMVTSLDFSSLGNQSAFNLTASPVKRTPKKKQSPLENIHSVIHLLALLQLQALKLVTESEQSQKTAGSGIQNSLNVLVDTFCLLFSNVASSNVIFNLIGLLAQPIGELLTDASKKTSVKVFSNSFQQKLETLWHDITTAVQSRYTGLIDAELLQKLSPLLEATFLHSRRQIKNLTMALWTSTFAKASSLDYPESLKPILAKVKAKTSVKLPGFSGTETIVIEETPVSQMTQTQAPEPHLPGMPSPHKIQHGSFLHKPVSPQPSRSPLKSPGSPGLGKLPNSAKKKLKPLEGFDDGDFVVIKYSPKKKMVLTEHQKEILKEKRALPAMYNSLENSVDASLMSAHFTTDTQMDGTLSETPTPSGSQPFSLFGSVIPPSQPQTANSSEIKESGTKTRDRTRKRTDEPKEKVKESKDKTVEESKTSFRRSGRNKSQEQTSELVEKATKESKRGRKKKNEAKDSETDSIILIEESEEMEVDIAEAIKEKPESSPEEGKKSIEIDLTKDSQVNDEQSMETQPPESSVEDKQETNDSKDDGSDKSGGQSSVASSVPQNVLGIVTYTQLSSSKSSREKPQEEDFGALQQSIDGNKSGNGGSDGNSGNMSDDEPLSSWSRKLTQLSQSPQVASPLGKKLTQGSSVSSEKRARSPLKSPKRNKKKLNDENEGKGVLDKWVIRSPGKDVDFGKVLNSMPNVAKEIVVANVSQTLVEETQSPSKFSKIKEKKPDGTSPSIMETPPKNILENIPVNFGNSNRKLFGSQSSNADLDIVEDSNLVPGSPDAKTYKLNSPVLKIKKLTNEDIQLFSPSWIDFKERKTVSNDVKDVQKETSDVHDDFSSFKPLEQSKSEKVLDAENVVNERSDNKGVTFPGSEAIFSEVIYDSSQKATDLGSESSKENKTSGIETGLDSDEDDNKMEIDDADSKEQGYSELDSQESSQAESQDESERIGLQSTPSGKSRKRKQIMPKKVSPEDRKVRKNRLSTQNSENVGSGRKVSARIKNKKMDSEENKEQEGSQEKKKMELDGKESDAKNKNLKNEKSSKDNQIVKDKTTEKPEKESMNNKNLKNEKSSKEMQEVKEKTSEKPEKERIEKQNKTNTKHVDNEKKGIQVSGEKGKDKQAVENKTNEQTKKKCNEIEKRSKKKTKDVDKEKKGIQDSSEMGKSSEKVGKGVSSQKKKDEVESEENIEDGSKNKTTRSLRKAKDNDSSSQKNKKSVDEDKKVDKDKEKAKSEQVYSGKMEQKAETSQRKARKNLKMVSEQPVGEKLDDSTKKIDDNVEIECEESSKENSWQEEATDSGKEDKTEMKESTKDSVNKLGENLDKEKDEINKKSIQDVENDQIESMDMDMESENTESQVEPVGEQTPDSKTVQQPERRSTAKHKKEVTQKLLKKRMIEDPIDLDSVTRSDDELPDIFKEQPKIDEQKAGEKECIKSVVSNFANVLASEKFLDADSFSDIDAIDETPKKTVNTAFLGALKLVAYSDSKLVLGSRKFQKKGGLARRSILKTSSLSAESDVSQSEGPNFHPIVVSHIYSPTASPSASILKRKRFMEDSVTETNSPPSKQRRVSFATPLIDVDNSLLPSNDSEPPSTPGTIQKEIKPDDSCSTPSSKPCDSQTQSSAGSPSQTHYESTQESQLNVSEPVYPDLVTCDQSVDKILPQLTSTIWHRGLGQLVRARNIRTIGDLASMSEIDIHSLPIRAPKVDTVRDVLSKFAKTQKSAKAKLWSLSKASKTEPSSKTPTEVVTRETEAVESTNVDEIPVVAPSSSDQPKCDSSASASVSSLEPIEKVHRLIEDLKKLNEGERKLVQEFFTMINESSSKN